MSVVSSPAGAAGAHDASARDGDAHDIDVYDTGTYSCTVCGARWPYAAIRVVGCCKHCGAGLARVERPRPTPARITSGDSATAAAQARRTP